MLTYRFIFAVMLGLFCGGPGRQVQEEPEAIPNTRAGGPMFAAAQIYFNLNSHPVTLEKIKKHLETKTGGGYRLVEWKGFTTTIPQLLIKGNPSWTLQIENDASYVPEEIEEMAEQAKGILSSGDLEILRSCNARMEAMACEDQKMPVPRDGVIVLKAATSLDPANPAVRRVLHEVATMVKGLIFDNVHGKWITKQQ